MSPRRVRAGGDVRRRVKARHVMVDVAGDDNDGHACRQGILVGGVVCFRARR